jgi:hypothetical protein
MHGDRTAVVKGDIRQESFVTFDKRAGLAGFGQEHGAGRGVEARGKGCGARVIVAKKSREHDAPCGEPSFQCDMVVRIFVFLRCRHHGAGKIVGVAAQGW